MDKEAQARVRENILLDSHQSVRNSFIKNMKMTPEEREYYDTHYPIERCAAAANWSVDELIEWRAWNQLMIRKSGIFTK